jgi:hypothetical protein
MVPCEHLLAWQPVHELLGQVIHLIALFLKRVG